MEHETELIRQILLGHRELFEQIILEYQNLVFTICLRIVHNPHDAENMAQETFLAAYRSLPDFRGGSFKSWLCRIAANKSIDYKRKQPWMPYEDWAEAADPTDIPLEERWEQQERRERLTGILSGLPPKYGGVIQAFYYRQLTVKEIARQLQLPERTVETRLYRAKKLIRERWGEDGA